MPNNIPQELLDVYAELVRNAPSQDHQRAHLINFAIDAENVSKAISDIIAAARQAGAVRNGQ